LGFRWGWLLPLLWVGEVSYKKAHMGGKKTWGSFICWFASLSAAPILRPEESEGSEKKQIRAPDPRGRGGCCAEKVRCFKKKLGGGGGTQAPPRGR